jgi:hypothetical protein
MVEQIDIEEIRRRGQPVERGTVEYKLLIEELGKLGDNIEEYGCVASQDAYKALVELLPEDDKDKYRKMLEAHTD